MKRQRERESLCCQFQFRFHRAPESERLRYHLRLSTATQDDAMTIKHLMSSFRVRAQYVARMLPSWCYQYNANTTEYTHHALTHTLAYPTIARTQTQSSIHRHWHTGTQPHCHRRCCPSQGWLLIDETLWPGTMIPFWYAEWLNIDTWPM